MDKPLPQRNQKAIKTNERQTGNNSNCIQNAMEMTRERKTSKHDNHHHNHHHDRHHDIHTKSIVVIIQSPDNLSSF